MQNKEVTLALTVTASITIFLLTTKLIAEEATLYGLAILLLLSFVPSVSTKEIKLKLSYFLIFLPLFIGLLFFINYLYR